MCIYVAYVNVVLHLLLLFTCFCAQLQLQGNIQFTFEKWQPIFVPFLPIRQMEGS